MLTTNMRASMQKVCRGCSIVFRLQIAFYCVLCWEAKDDATCHLTIILEYIFLGAMTGSNKIYCVWTTITRSVCSGSLDGQVHGNNRNKLRTHANSYTSDSGVR